MNGSKVCFLSANVRQIYSDRGCEGSEGVYLYFGLNFWPFVRKNDSILAKKNAFFNSNFRTQVEIKCMKWAESVFSLAHTTSDIF